MQLAIGKVQVRRWWMDGIAHARARGTPTARHWANKSRDVSRAWRACWYGDLTRMASWHVGMRLQVHVFGQFMHSCRVPWQNNVNIIKTIQVYY